MADNNIEDDQPFDENRQILLLDGLSQLIDYIKSTVPFSAIPLVVLVSQIERITSLGSVKFNYILIGAILAFILATLLTMYFLIYVRIWRALETLKSADHGQVLDKIADEVNTRYNFFYRRFSKNVDANVQFHSEERVVLLAKRTKFIFVTCMVIGWLCSIALVLFAIPFFEAPVEKCSFVENLLGSC